MKCFAFAPLQSIRPTYPTADISPRILMLLLSLLTSALTLVYPVHGATLNFRNTCTSSVSCEQGQVCVGFFPFSGRCLNEALKDAKCFVRDAEFYRGILRKVPTCAEGLRCVPNSAGLDVGVCFFSLQVTCVTNLTQQLLDMSDNRGLFQQY